MVPRTNGSPRPVCRDDGNDDQKAVDKQVHGQSEPNFERHLHDDDAAVFPIFRNDDDEGGNEDETGRGDPFVRGTVQDADDAKCVSCCP